MPELILKLGESVVGRFLFDKDIMSIGRSRDNDVVIENLSVSRNHARIRRQEGKYILTDLNSANGTFVNGVRISKTEIVDDDIISVGKHKVHFANKLLSDEEMILDTFGADRTMLVDNAPIPLIVITDGRLKGREYHLSKTDTTIGKASTNDIVIGDDWFLSRKQAVISRTASGFEIRDLGGFRKTRVNGTVISDPVVLKPGAEIEFGNTKAVFQVRSPQPVAPPDARKPQELGLEDSVFSSGILEPNTPLVASIYAQREAERRQPTPEALEAQIVAVADAKPEAEGAPQTAELLEEEMASVEPEAASREQQDSRRHGRHGRKRRREQRAAAEEMVTGRFSGEGAPARPPGAPPAETEQVATEHDEEQEPVTLRASDEAAALKETVRQPVVPELVAQPSPSPRDSRADFSAEVALWEKALENRSPIVRKQAARMLKKLTGRDYAY